MGRMSDIEITSICFKIFENSLAMCKGTSSYMQIFNEKIAKISEDHKTRNMWS
jgi:hypothetical protein